MHNVQVTPLIGLPQFNGWSQVVVNHDSTVTVALSVSGQNAGNIGRDLVAQIKETSPNSVEAFYRLLQDLKLDTEDLGVVLGLSAAYVVDTGISYATLRGSVILKRGEKVGKVLSSEDELSLIQGKTQVDDVVVLATQAAASFLGEIQQKATQGYAPDVIIKSLAPGIHKEADTATLSIGFMVFEPETEAVPETTPGSEVAIETPVSMEPEVESFFSRESDSQPLRTPLEFPAPDSEFESPLPEAEPAPAIADFTATSTFVSDISLTRESVTPEIPPSKPTQPKKPFKERVAPILGLLSTLGKGLGTGIGNVIAKFKRKPALPPPPLQLPARAGEGMTPLRVEPSAYTAPESSPLRFNEATFGQKSSVYLASEQAAKKKLIVVVVFLVVCAVGGFLFWRQRQGQQVQAAQAELAPLMTEFSAAQEQVASDPVGGRAKMQEILNQMQQLRLRYQGQGAAERSLSEDIAQAQATYDSLSGKEALTSLNVFFDLAQAQPGFLATKIVSDGQNLVAVDTEKKEVLSLTLADKTPKLLTVADLPSDPSLYLSNAELLLLGGGVRSLNISQEAPTLQSVIPEGDSNRDATLLSRFGNYIYVLNPVKRNIFRYLVQEGNVSEPIGWVRPGQPLPYESLNSFKIDGDVWLTTADGQIFKFTSGDQQDFSISGLSQPFTTPIILDTKEDMANLYILEPAARRVVILSKTGQFLKEVQSQSLATASDIVADEARGVILVLSGSLVFEIPI